MGELSHPLPETKNFGLPVTKNYRQYLAEDQALQDRSKAEIRLHEAIEDIYGSDPKPHPLENDKEFDALLDALFPEKPQEKIALLIVSPNSISDALATVTQAPVQTVSNSSAQKKTILDFDNARVLLVSHRDKLQGNVVVSDFEDACKFFLEFGSKDIDAEYQDEQSLRQTSILKNFTSGVAKAKMAVRSGSPDDLILDRVLRVSGLDSNRVPSSNDNILSLSFAKIYFFLKEHASKEMSEGAVFETFAKPLIEHLLSKAKTINMPTKPKSVSRSNKANQKQKELRYSREFAAYQKALKESIPEIYNFITEKLGGDVPEVINQRLKELKS